MIISGTRWDDQLQGGDDASLTINGYGGADSLIGGIYSDALFGGSGSDTLRASAGDDSLYGESGEDLLEGNSGNDLIDGGAGTDTVLYDFYRTGSPVAIVFDGSGIGMPDRTVTVDAGVFGSDVLVGIENLHVVASNEADWVIGGGGNDRLFALDGRDTLEGGNGDDYLIGGSSWNESSGDVVLGGPGDDTLVGSIYSIDTLNGGPGYDTVRLDFANEYGIRFDASAIKPGVFVASIGWGYRQSYSKSYFDSFTSIESVDVVGSQFADRITGSGGHDSILGGKGNDYLRTSGGDDRAYGEEGADTILGGLGADLLEGGTGADRLYGDYGNDTLQGGVGNDSLEGGDGVDRLFGDAGSDTLKGGTGDSSRGSLLSGGNDSDSIEGGSGFDQLIGGNGDDTLTSGAGLDVMQGDGGRDMFLFDTPLAGNSEYDSIYDFVSGTDRIGLSADIFTSFYESESLRPEQFYAAPGASEAQTSEHRLIYGTETGELYYDADGSSLHFAPIMIALLYGSDGVAALALTDFVIVM